jgi:hypothetical protein
VRFFLFVIFSLAARFSGLTMMRASATENDKMSSSVYCEIHLHLTWHQRKHHPDGTTQERLEQTDRPEERVENG